jgi:flavin reductase (DIM6/NTAB) family NADH-FMN oxidoreductase RutF
MTRAGFSIPEQEAASIREAMDAFSDRTDHPLMVVTVVGRAGELSGCLVGFVTQCSIHPPRFLVCISKVNHTYFVAEQADAIALHLLGDRQTELASLFGEMSGDAVRRFDQCDWHRATTGAPVLDHCAVWLEGVVLDRFSVGDHEAFLMRPTAGSRGTCGGLLTAHNAPDLNPGHPAIP